MLEKIFLQILNMSFIASFVIIFVLIARLLLKRSPKVLSYALWGVVLFRLVFPFSFESVFSLLPVKTNPISQDIVYAPIPKVDTGISAINHAVNSSLPAATPAASINPMQIWVFIGTTVWILGIAVLLIYSIFSLMKLHKRLKNAVHERDNIYLAEYLETPFVMGIIRPRIYLPASLTAEEKRYIILHEEMHIKRFDHIVKIFSFFVLCLHWFNPLVWAAFFISGKDMEMSCDEAVIKQLGSNVKKEYSASLLTLATGRRIIGGTPLAFGEGDTKGRIKNVLNYKKPAFWVVVLAVIAVIILAVGLSSNPMNAPIVLPDKGEVSSIQIEQVNEGDSLGVVQITDIADIEIILDALQNTNKTFRKSVNDAPNSKNYFRIYIESTTLQRFFLFAEGNKYYIEEAYSGIYKTSRETSVSVAKIYISNGGADLEDTTTALWNARTKYIGDNSAVGNIISLLQFPEGVAYDSFELHTSESPYAVTVKFKTDTEIRNFYSGADNQSPFQINALIMFSLIENAEYITFSLNDGIYDPYSIQYTDDMAKMILGDNYRKDSENLDGFRSQIEKLQELLSIRNER